jgi:hypothetical protein
LLREYFKKHNIGYKIISCNFSKLYKNNNFYDIIEINKFYESLKCCMYRFYIVTDINILKVLTYIEEFENILLFDPLTCFTQYDNILYDIISKKNVFFLNNTHQQKLCEYYDITKINYF